MNFRTFHGLQPADRTAAPLNTRARIDGVSSPAFNNTETALLFLTSRMLFLTSRKSRYRRP